MHILLIFFVFLQSCVLVFLTMIGGKHLNCTDVQGLKGLIYRVVYLFNLLKQHKYTFQIAFQYF